MKYEEAMSIIDANKQKGYMISFEKLDGHILVSDHFPDPHEGEELIKTEEKAWELAKKFANATDNSYVNIYVTDESFSPVAGYDKKILKRR